MDFLDKVRAWLRSRREPEEAEAEPRRRGEPIARLRVQLRRRARLQVEEASLLQAVRAGDERSVRALLERGARPDEERTSQGRTALWLAADRGLYHVAEQLLLFGADPAREDRSGVSALAQARSRGHDDVAALLARPPGRIFPRIRPQLQLQEQLPPPAQEQLPPPAQVEAAAGPLLRLLVRLQVWAREWVQIVGAALTRRGAPRTLLEQDPQEEDEDENEDGQRGYAMIRKLHEKLVPAEAASAAEAAEEQPEVQAPVPRRLRASFSTECSVQVDVLDVDAADGSGRTALHRAAKKNDVATVRFLLSLGARTDLRDHDGRTPCDLAALDEVRRLLEPRPPSPWATATTPPKRPSDS